MGAALALPDDQLTTAAGALAGVYARHGETALGHECLLHLAVKSYILHLRIPGVIPAAEVLAYAASGRHSLARSPRRLSSWCKSGEGAPVSRDQSRG